MGLTSIIVFIKGSKIAQYALLAVVLAGAYFAWTAHERSIGKQQGIETQKDVETQQVGKTVLDATNTESAEVAEAHAREAEARRATAQAQQQTAIAMAMVVKLQRDGEELRAKVAAISDADLHGFTVAQMGIRKPDDKTACYTATEERAIANAVTQWPVCKAESEGKDDAFKQQGEQIAGLQRDVQAMKDEISAHQAAESVYRTALQTLYDNHAPKVRAAKCLGIWKCGRGRLEIPNPAVLESQVKKGKP